MEERLMASARKRKKQRRRNRKLGDCVRQFLTPAVWKQVQTGMLRPWQASRWRIQPLVMTLILLTFACGDSQEERFECARAVVVALLPKRRRPGKTVHGFEKALVRLPMWLLRRVSTAVRRRLCEVLAHRWTTHGFVVLGCDGSRLECPRAVALEERMGQAGKQDAAPTMWLTALVHLAAGVPYAWRVGKGTASERDHLKHLLGVLPSAALVVCDAGYTGYDLCAFMLENGVDFLIRMSSTVTLYTTMMQPLETYQEGIVYYWTDQAQGWIAGPEVAVDTARGRAGREEGKAEVRRVAADECVVIAAVAGGTCGSLVPLAMGKRGILQDLQTDAQHGQARQPNGGLASPGGRRFLVGYAVVAKSLFVIVEQIGV